MCVQQIFIHSPLSQQTELIVETELKVLIQRKIQNTSCFDIIINKSTENKQKKVFVQIKKKQDPSETFHKAKIKRAKNYIANF